MPASADEWFDRHWDRSLRSVSAQGDIVKVMVTITLGFAVVIVAMALQVDSRDGWHVAATSALGAAAAATVAVMLLDRSKTPNLVKVLEKQRDEQWNDDQLIAYLRRLMQDTEVENRLVLRRLKVAAECQAGLSFVAAALAVVSLFLGP